MNSLHPVILPFLGERDYLHGTTLFRYIRALAPENARVCFRIMRITRSNTVRVVDSNSISYPVARLDWRCGGAQKSLAVEQLPCGGPLQREDYDECSVTMKATVDETVAILKTPSPFDAVATAVPLFKEILKARSMNRPGGQWMFTRLDTHDSEPSLEAPFELRLESARPGAVAKASIHIGSSFWADIYFSWVAELRQ